MRHKLHIVLLLTLLAFTSCLEEIPVFDSKPTEALYLAALLKLNGVNCSYDVEMEILRIQLSADTVRNFSPIVEFDKNSKVYFEGIQLQNQTANSFGEVRINQEYAVQIIQGNTRKNLQLIFTNLPIVQLITDQPIYDEPKSLGRVQIHSSVQEHLFSSFAGIELRGRYSREYDKKSMGFALWEGMTREQEFSKGLLGLRNNSDWILGAAFIDPSRIRNLVSFTLWNELQDEESDPLGIRSEMVEVFRNNKFLGLYIFSELLNEQLLKVGNEAFLYKGIDWSDGAVTFERYDPEISHNQFWNGWEQKKPDNKELINWNPLNDLYNTVVDADDETFRKEISKHLNLDNAIDYYLLLNLAYATDNTGKNTFLFAENRNIPFKYIPWDLDGSWGIAYDGSKTPTDKMLSNHLFDRLLETNPENFKEKLRARWFYLRESTFSEQNIQNTFDGYFQKMNTSDIISMENQIWDLSLDMEEEQENIYNWASERLIFLDKHIGSF